MPHGGFPLGNKYLIAVVRGSRSVVKMCGIMMIEGHDNRETLTDP